MAVLFLLLVLFAMARGSLNGCQITYNGLIMSCYTPGSRDLTSHPPMLSVRIVIGSRWNKAVRIDKDSFPHLQAIQLSNSAVTCGKISGREGISVTINGNACATSSTVSTDQSSTFPPTISAPTYVITSPGYPGNYPTNLRFAVSIGVPYDETEGYVTLHFLKFDLQQCDFCNCDYLHIDTLHESFCGTNLPPSYKNNTIIIPRKDIHNNLITLHFRSDDRIQYGGFAIRYRLHTHRPTASPPPCNTTCPSCSPGYIKHTTYSSPNCWVCRCVSVTTRRSTTTPGVSRCPVVQAITCPKWYTTKIEYPKPDYCPRSVCQASPSTTPCSIPLCTLPCSYNYQIEIRQSPFEICPRCICVKMKFTTTATTQCPTVMCPTCLPGYTAESFRDNGCPTCRCFPSKRQASTTKSPASSNVLVRMLQHLANEAGTLESSAHNLQQYAQLAMDIAQHGGTFRDSLLSARIRDVLDAQKRLEDSGRQKEQPMNK